MAQTEVKVSTHNTILVTDDHARQVSATSRLCPASSMVNHTVPTGLASELVTIVCNACCRSLDHDVKDNTQRFDDIAEEQQQRLCSDTHTRTDTHTSGRPMHPTLTQTVEYRHCCLMCTITGHPTVFHALHQVHPDKDFSSQSVAHLILRSPSHTHCPPSSTCF